jgi:predicted enzyme related to lactoylglutathione lyase
LTVIDYIELPARRLSETKEFYSAVFGWDWIDYGPTYAATEGNSPEVALNGLATTGRLQPLGSENSFGPFVLFSTDDLEALRARILDAGGAMVSEPYAFPGGRRLHFQDPSGNVLGAYQETSST